MLKILTSQPLPNEEHDFFDLVKIYFPNIYDVKYLMKSCKNLKGGLQEVADQLEVIVVLTFFKECHSDDCCCNLYSGMSLRCDCFCNIC